MDNQSQNDYELRQRLRRALLQETSIFGNLLAISALRDPVTGGYKHDLTQDCPDRGERILRRLHREVFMEWLNLTLEEQEEDIRLWIASRGLRRDTSIDVLLALESEAYCLIPAKSSRPERKLFVSDLRVVIDLMTE